MNAGPSLLQQEVAEKLAAHRQRRARMVPTIPMVPMVPVSAAHEPAPGTSRIAEGELFGDDLPQRAAKRARNPASRAIPGEAVSRRPRNPIAAAVVERFAQTPSYRAILAEEAERATQQAAAAAEVAARNAEAAAAVQQELLAELELWSAPQHFTAETAVIAPAAAETAEAYPVQAATLTVRLYEEARLESPLRTEPHVAPVLTAQTTEDASALHALDEEIAFRQAPVFEEYSIDPPIPLPANLLEFPRQLVAPKKARPRLAEGPLREDAPRSPQLRIFEVEPEQISTTPAAIPAAPEWANIRLDAHSVVEAVSPASHRLTPMPAYVTPQPAPISLRLMAFLVDAGLVAGAFLGGVAGAVKLSGWLPGGVEAIAIAIASLAGLYIAYYLLFFTLADQTPGMRYARIGLCTFTDENPTRANMRKRLLAQIIAFAPLGIGLLWALLDDDGLGWHDRISGMYQRAY